MFSSDASVPLVFFVTGPSVDCRDVRVRSVSRLECSLIN